MVLTAPCRLSDLFGAIQLFQPPTTNSASPRFSQVDSSEASGQGWLVLLQDLFTMSNRQTSDSVIVTIQSINESFNSSLAFCLKIGGNYLSKVGQEKRINSLLYCKYDKTNHIG